MHNAINAPRRTRTWFTIAAETTMIATSFAYVMTGGVWTLLLWDLVAGLYLLVGAALVWNLSANTGRSDRRIAADGQRWGWVLPLVSSVTGVNSAIIALTVRETAARDLGSGVLAAAACIGVVLSWLLLHVGFADLYRHMSLAAPGPAFEFPGTADPTPSDYLYFSFAIGATFATSDVDVVSSSSRRAVTVHSIVGFFYNALVVAIAIQVLQGILGS